MKKWPYFLISAAFILLIIIAISGVFGGLSGLGGSKESTADTEPAAVPEIAESRQTSSETTQLIYSEEERQQYEQDREDSLSDNLPLLDEQAKAIQEDLEHSKELLTDVRNGYFSDYDSGDLSARWSFVDESGNEFILWHPFLMGNLNPDELGSPYNIPSDVLLKIYWKRLQYPDGSKEDVITGYEILD